MKLCAGFVLFLMTCAQAQEKGLLTIFREAKPAFPSINPLHKTEIDDRRIIQLHILCDGKPLMTLKDGKFLTVKLTLGEHVLTSTDRWKGDPYTFKIKPNEHLFLRPLKEQSGHIMWKSQMVALSCHEARELGRDAQPIKGKEVGDYPAVDELRFPSCED